MGDHRLELLVFFLALLNSQVHASTIVNVTILERALKRGAVCLDGSPPAYYHAPGSGEGINNWMVYLEGGGWCGSEVGCLHKINSTYLGSGSTRYTPKTASFQGILGDSQVTNPDFFNWNRVYVRYCDGASFTGEVKEVDPRNNLHRRGARIFTAVTRDLRARGMKYAKNVILTGSSAGGLAVLLNCDKFRALVPKATRVKCIADSGFFIPVEKVPGSNFRMERAFSSIVAFHGVEKFLPQPCTSIMDPGLCLFPKNLVGYIQTPLFIVNSAFDSYQIQTSMDPVGPGWENCSRQLLTNCTTDQLQAMKGFRTAFLDALPKSDCSSIGMFINTCYHHDQLSLDFRWNGFTFDNKTIAKAVGDWYFDRSSFQEIDIDTRHEFPTVCFGNTNL